MTSPNELDRTQQSAPSSTTLQLVRYIEKINTRVYGDKEVREVLWAVTSLAGTANKDHVTKQQVATEAGLNLQTLHNTSALQILEGFGIVELIQKVHRKKGTYVIIDERLCRWLESAGQYGPNEPPDENEFPDIYKKVERYGDYLDEEDWFEPKPIGKPTPTEVNFELVALDLDVGPPVTATVTIQSTKMDQDSGTTRWQFKLEGRIEGDLDGVSKDEIKNRIEKEMFARIRAALEKHRVACWCESLTEHLINVAGRKANCIDKDSCHVVVHPEESTIEFEITITKIKRDSNV